MHSYAERNKRHHTPGPLSQGGKAGGPASARLPNSSLSTLVGGAGSGYAIPDLEHRMQARLPGVSARPQQQIPQAEQEADRLSAAIHAGTPESVKAAMGARMGADFSGVRFHTGAAAAAKADAMGARAYTSGADVYFGSGGFDPSVAAHELVHTAQQGMVGSGTPVLSTPVGGIQMVPNPFAWAWRKTGGRAIRHHHDAMEEYQKAQQSQQWDQLSTTNKARWIAHNPAAYLHYKHSDSAQQETTARAAKREKEQKAAEDFLKQQPNTPSSMITTDASGAMQIGRGKADAVEFQAPTGGTAKKLAKKAVHGIEHLSSFTDNITSPVLDITSGSLEAADKTGAANIVGSVGGALGIGTGIVGGIEDVKDMVENIQDRQYLKLGGTSASLLGNLSNVGGGAASIGKAALKGGSNGYEAAGEAVASFGIISGTADMAKGGITIADSSINRHRLSRFEGKNFGELSREEILKQGSNPKSGLTEQQAKQHLLMRDITAQGKMENTRKIVEGIGDVATGAMDVIAGGMELGGVTAGAGAGVTALSAATKSGFAAYDKYQKTRMENKVAEQTTGITDEMIRKFQKDANIGSYSRAKQALYKSMGYSTGYRAEAYADQTEKRGELLAQMANSGTKDKETEMARELSRSLGVKADKKTGAYDAEKLSDAMGLRDSRAKIAARKHRLAYLAKTQP